ncbi:MAG: hypothetical protein K2Q45_06565 [Nitrosomonas sp.]|nr:hypothetical protein [Nitrosomonas sp.]
MKKKLFFYIQMMAGFVEVPEPEWVQLGNATKIIRDWLMDFCIISCERFGKSSSMYKSFNTLDTCFLRVRSKLDDFVCGAYPMNKHDVAGQSITSVFFGQRITPSYISPTSYKRGQLPKSFDGTHRHQFDLLIKNIEALFASLNQHPYIVARFKGGRDANAHLKRFYKCLQKTKDLVAAQ